MSSALPAATPPNTSNSTTSPSSFRPIRWASVPPILPAPIRAILLRAIWVSLTRARSTAVAGERAAARRVPGGPEGGVASLSGDGRQGGAMQQCGKCHRLRVRHAEPVRLRLTNHCGRSSQVRQLQPFLALHFLQPRRGALEHLRVLPALVQLVRHRVRRGHQLHPMIVQRIDQHDEAARLVVVVGRQARDAVEDQRVDSASPAPGSRRRPARCRTAGRNRSARRLRPPAAR